MKLWMFFLFTFLLFTTCKKRLFDYRNKYVGDYEFSGYHYISSVTTGDQETVYFNKEEGRLSYKKSDDRDVMTIEIDDFFTENFEIDKDGIINFCGYSGHIDDDFELHVSFDKYACESGKPSIAARHQYVFTGEKK